jgi:hypothetical protein
MIRAQIDGDPEENVLEGAQQIRVVLFWSDDQKFYKAAEIVITHNEPFPTPVVSVTLPHPGIRADVYDWKGNLIQTTKPREKAAAK